MPEMTPTPPKEKKKKKKKAEGSDELKQTIAALQGELSACEAGSEGGRSGPPRIGPKARRRRP